MAAARSPHRHHAPGAARPRSQHYLRDQPRGCSTGRCASRQGHKPAQSWIPGQIVPADRAALPVTMPSGHPHTPTASRPPQPHPGHRAGHDPLRPARLTRECLSPPRPRRRQHHPRRPRPRQLNPVRPVAGKRALPRWSWLHCPGRVAPGRAPHPPAGAGITGQPPVIRHCGRPSACGGLAGFRQG